MGGGATTSEAERLAVGIASQNSRGKKAFGEATGVGATGRVPRVSIHGPSPWKLVGDRERKELKRAARLAKTKAKTAIAGSFFRVGLSKKTKGRCLRFAV